MVNQYVAAKLLEEFMQAEAAYVLAGTPHAEFLKRRANRYHGQTRKELLKVANLGEQANVWMRCFVEALNDDEVFGS